MSKVHIVTREEIQKVVKGYKEALTVGDLANSLGLKISQVNNIITRIRSIKPELLPKKRKGPWLDALIAETIKEL